MTSIKLYEGVVRRENLETIDGKPLSDLKFYVLEFRASC
jgi:hypothetical protein